MKLACVIHRYGADFAGGSEAHCRALAERLAANHAVTVLTTTARDYVTWENHYAPGASALGPVNILRFPVARQRNLARLAELTDRALAHDATEADQLEWFSENGPVVPGLIEHLRAHGHEFDFVLCWSFRYYTAFHAVQAMPARAVLVPTAEEDPVLWMDYLRRFFPMPAGHIFLTPEEQALVTERAAAPLGPSIVIGGGLDAPAPVPDAEVEAALASVGVRAPYALYLGRVDRNKGCEPLFEFYTAYADRGGALPLVLAGPAAMPVPDHPAVRPLGYVSDTVRDALLARARVLVVPSPYESLSLALLEGWNHGRPAIVNARCRVLKGQVRRADGGLFYRNAHEFAECLTYAVDHAETMEQLGRQGQAYVDREYRWPHIMAKVERFLADLHARR